METTDYYTHVGVYLLILFSYYLAFVIYFVSSIDAAHKGQRDKCKKSVGIYSNGNYKLYLYHFQCMWFVAVLIPFQHEIHTPNKYNDENRNEPRWGETKNAH